LRVLKPANTHYFLVLAGSQTRNVHYFLVLAGSQTRKYALLFSACGFSNPQRALLCGFENPQAPANTHYFAGLRTRKHNKMLFVRTQTTEKEKVYQKTLQVGGNPR
jgi:hypothetical protein